MGWLIELLFESVKELCSQFIVDMMDIASSMFTEILSCDLNLFEELFGVAGDLYRNAVLPIAVMLLLMILVWQLFKSMFGKLGASSEDPIELIFRSTFSFFMIAFSKDIVNYILDIAGTPYQWVVGTAVSVDSFSQYVSAAEAVVSVLGIDVMSIQILLLIMHFVVAWNYFKMLFILAERYVLLGIFSYTAPLAFATGGSKSTNNIQASWVKMFGGQVVIVILDAWCLKMFLSGYGNLMASSYGFTKFFAATMCLIGFCKIAAKLDSYMASLGVNLGRIGGGLSGMGALLMAGRLLRVGGGNGTKGSAGSDRAGGRMAFGGGKPIPMGAGSPDFGAAGMSGMQKGSGIGGVNAEDAFGGMSPAGDENGMKGAVGGFDDFQTKAQGMENQNQPFGMPDDTDFMMPEDFAGGVQSTEGMEMENPGMETGSFSPFAEGEDFGDSSLTGAGELPGMDMPEGGPFGSASDENDYGMAVGMETEESAVPAMTGMEPASSMDMDAVHDGISGMQPEAGTEERADGQEVSFGTETGENGIMSYGGAASQMEASQMETSGGSISEAGAGGVSGLNDTVAGGNDFAGSAGGMEMSGTQESGSIQTVQHSGVSESGETAPHMPENAGMYAAERDGERYMRYDAGRYEKPQGAYQTIHENGKAFYELPEKEKGPELLPETKAVLEKNGTIRLEKVTKEYIPADGRKEPADRTRRKPGEKKGAAGKSPGRKKRN